MRSKEQPYWDKRSLAKTWKPEKGTGRTFAQAVREMRLRLGDSTYQFAKRVGSNQTSVWMCEQGRRGVRYLVAKRLWHLARRHGMRDLASAFQVKMRAAENRLGGKGWR
jgi:ribosome-binding protein aMBF1 (putative translation factor)